MIIYKFLIYSFLIFKQKGPDPSPNEFPIFNVSHNPESPYPNPINHLYDKRYKEAYSTFYKPNQAAASTSQKPEPSSPASPSAPQPKPSSNSSSYPTHSQGQQQQQPKSNSNSSSYPTHSQGQQQQQPKPNSNSSSYPTHSQGQQQQPNIQRPYPPGFIPGVQEQQAAYWQNMNPYATMPRSHAAYYQQQQQQASKLPQSNQEQPSTYSPEGVRRSSTSEDVRPHSLSRSTSSNELNSGKEKIRVRVINDNSASSSYDPQTNTSSNNRFQTQRSILRTNNNDDDSKQKVPTHTIYTSSENEISKETIEDIFKAVNGQRSESTQSTSSPMVERIIIIDRRGSSAPDNNSNSSGTDRIRTVEVRTSTAGTTPSTPSTPTATAATTTTTSTPTATTNTASNAYAFQQPNYYGGQQLYYQQPRMYASTPNMFSAATPYVPGLNNFYPYRYY
jgi:hypothetical protein